MSQDNTWGDPQPASRLGPAADQAGGRIKIVCTFNPDDQAWIRRTPIVVPRFWDGHAVSPARGDVLRFGGRQFVIEARVWEHDGATPVLRLFVGSAHAESDTVFG